MFKKSNAGDQLLIAVKLNKISEISRLVALGVDVNSRIDKNGKTALHYAAYKGQAVAVKALVEAGADLDVTDENGMTALHRAIIHGHTDVVHILLKAGCLIDQKDENGNTALHEAAWNGYSKCVELLVAGKCNINIHNRTGYTSLHLAAQNCHYKTLQVLLDGGCNALVKNNYGDTPLHIAVRYGHDEVCKALLATELNISEQNNDGNTPLHIAASMGHEKLIEMLLNAGSSTTVKNNVGDTARELALQNGFKAIAKLLGPTKGDTRRMLKNDRKEKRRPHSLDVSELFNGVTDSTINTTTSQLWRPGPLSEGRDAEKEERKQDFSSRFSWGKKKKEERKSKILTIKYDEMCSIERDFVKKRKASLKKSRKTRSRSSLKSQEEARSDPGLHHGRRESKRLHSRGKEEKAESAPSRDDLEESLSQKKTKKEKGFFSLFRSASDPDLKNALFCTKPKEKFPPSGGEVMGNGVHKVKKESKEKEEQEETREKKDKRKKDKKDKKGHEEEREKWEKKEKRKDKEKEKKYPRRDEKDGNESDCTICQEKRRKSREKRRSEEVKHKERRSKSEPRRERDRRDVDSDEKDFKTHVDKDDGDREHRKKKHHKEKEKEKDRARRDKSHKRKTDEHGRSNERKEVVHRMGADFETTPCNQSHCSTCQTQLSRLEAWQERCTAEIDSARRRLEHRLQRLENRLTEQLKEEKKLQEKGSRSKKHERTTDSRLVSKSLKDSSNNIREEMRGVIKGGLSKLELRLGQISAGYNMPFIDQNERCNPELGKNCATDRGIRRLRSMSSPHLGRSPCEDCMHHLENSGGMSPPFSQLASSGTCSSSRTQISDTGSVETVIEARPVGNRAGLHSSGTIIEAKPVAEVLDTVIEAQPVVEDENSHKVHETLAATQVHHQRQMQEVENWWRAKAEEEQGVLYARICELEQMLMMSRGGDCFV